MSYTPTTIELKNVVNAVRDRIDPMICGFAASFGSPMNATVYRIDRGETRSDISLTPLWDVVEGEVLESDAEVPEEVEYVATAPNRGYFQCSEGEKYLPLLT